MFDRTDAIRMARRPMVGLRAIVGKYDKRDDGQGLVEYALILMLVALVAIAALALLGPAANDAIQFVSEQFP